MAELGFEYRDKATGWTGIATARTEYLGDSPSVRLQHVDQAGELCEAWFAEGRLEPAPQARFPGFGTASGVQPMENPYATHQEDA